MTIFKVHTGFISPQEGIINLRQFRATKRMLLHVSVNKNPRTTIQPRNTVVSRAVHDSNTTNN